MKLGEAVLSQKLQQQRWRWKILGWHQSHIKEVQIKHPTDQAFIASLKGKSIFKTSFSLFPSFRTCKHKNQVENIYRPFNYSVLPDAFEDCKKTFKGKAKHNDVINIYTKKAQEITVCIKAKLMDRYHRSCDRKMYEYFHFFQLL